MTISNENSKDVFDIDGASEMLYTFTFDITDESEVFVEMFDSNGSSLGLTWTRVTSAAGMLKDQYYVDLANSQITIGPSPDTTLLQSIYNSGDVDDLVISRVLPFTQSSAFPSATSFSTTSLENRLDKITLLAQQLQEQINRSILSSPTDNTGTPLELPEASDGKGLFWDGVNLANTANDIETIDDSATSAAEAAASAAEAAASAAGVNLPAIVGGDATKHLQVNGAETAYELVTKASISADKLPLAGGVMTDEITGLPAPTSGSSAANRDYVDGHGVIQEDYIQDGVVSTGLTTQIPADTTIPQQSTEGDLVMSLAFTPVSATSKLKIEVVVNYSAGAANQGVCAALFQDAIENALAVGMGETVAAFRTGGNIKFTHHIDVSGAGARTYKVHLGAHTATALTFNGHGGVVLYGGVLASSITVTELKA